MDLGDIGVFELPVAGFPDGGPLSGSGLAGVSPGAANLIVFKSARIRTVMASTGESANDSTAPFADDCPYPIEVQPIDAQIVAAANSPAIVPKRGRINWN
jgi:hypothetical protein